jgi:hypothetical protein
VDQKSGTTPADSAAQALDEGRSADAEASANQSDIGRPGFGARGRMRRRARFLRKARELAYRDLGGLVFNLHRFGQRNDTLVIAKLTTLGQIDAELRTLETALDERRPVTVLREAGITACARCAAIHSSEDRFCPNCGLSLGPHSDLPIAGAPASATSAPIPSPATTAQASANEPAPLAAPVQPAAPSPSVSEAVPVPARAPQPETAQWPRETVPAGDGAGSPNAPVPSASRRSQTTADEDEPTEILHPPSAGP